MKFRKKPVVIEATQWFKIGDHPQVIYKDACDAFPDQHCVIKTLEGWMRVTAGDYIIKGVRGEFYPCKPDIFELTYEVVTP